ncbi:MAG: hypothetical protein WAU17_10230 [Nitrospirales bacterium]
MESFLEMSGQQKEDVLRDEAIFGLGTDSSRYSQNDNGDGERLGDKGDLAEPWSLQPGHRFFGVASE